jgi:hypothetical protein
VIVWRLDIAKAGAGDYIAHRHELGFYPEQLNRKQLLELVNQLIAQSGSATQCPGRYSRFELHPFPLFPDLAFSQQ